MSNDSRRTATMHAQLLLAFGDSRSFGLAEVPLPDPSDNGVFVRVNSIGINSLETKIRSGWLEEHFPVHLPAILGKEFAGTVEQIGEAVTSFAVGDRVAGFSESGAYAGFAIAYFTRGARCNPWCEPVCTRRVSVIRSPPHGSPDSARILCGMGNLHSVLCHPWAGGLRVAATPTEDCHRRLANMR